MALTTGRKRVTEPTLEIEQRKLVSLASADFIWDTGLDTNSWFKVVTAADCFLKCKLLGETYTDTEAKALGYYPFPTGEGSNAKVVKLYHDDSNTIGGAIFAVR
jgi:hypothetical protein